MTRNPRRRALQALATAAALTTAIGIAVPAVADSIHDKKKAADAQVHNLQSAISQDDADETQADKALAQTRQLFDAAQGRLTTANQNLAASKAKEHQLAVRLAGATQAVAAGQEQVAANKSKLADALSQAGAIANEQYASGGSTGMLALILTSKSVGALADAKHLMENLSADQASVISSVQATQASLEAAQRALVAAQQQAVTLHAQAAAQVVTSQQLQVQAAQAQAALDALVKQRAAQLAAIQTRKTAEQQALQNAQAQSAALQQQINAAEAAAEQGGGGSSATPTGGLIWPASGPMVTPAGPRTNPVTGLLSCHAGIDIAAGYGAPIHAAAGGTVIDEFYSTWDGNVTVIAHGGGMATWYAHQSSRAVGVGTHVAQGQTIGYVGATGFATGPHLHFNVTLNGVLWDPMGWFGGPRREVASLCAPPYPQPTP